MNAPISKRADQLVVGDRIEDSCLPVYSGEGDGEVLFTRTYHYNGADWAFVAYVTPDGNHNSTSYLPEERLLVIPADTGLDYSRPDENPQPAAGRTPAHFGAVTDASLVPEPIARHYDVSEVGTADCACGKWFGDTEMLRHHIEQANAPVPVVDEGGHTAVAVAGGLIEIDPPKVFACTAHGVHPHPGGGGGFMVCLDCPECRPPGASVD